MGAAAAARVRPREPGLRRVALASSELDAALGIDAELEALIGDAEDAQIAAIGGEGKVEEIADDGDGAAHEIDRDVAEHGGDLRAARAEAVAFPHDVEGDGGRDDIARDGHEADERIKADALVRAGKLDAGIHEASDQAEALHAAGPSRGEIGPRDCGTIVTFITCAVPCAGGGVVHRSGECGEEAVVVASESGHLHLVREARRGFRRLFPCGENQVNLDADGRGDALAHRDGVVPDAEISELDVECGAQAKEVALGDAAGRVAGGDHDERHAGDLNCACDTAQRELTDQCGLAALASRNFNGANVANFLNDEVDPRGLCLVEPGVGRDLICEGRIGGDEVSGREAEVGTGEGRACFGRAFDGEGADVNRGGGDGLERALARDDRGTLLALQGTILAAARCELLGGLRLGGVGLGRRVGWGGRGGPGGRRLRVGWLCGGWRWRERERRQAEREEDRRAAINSHPRVV